MGGGFCLTRFLDEVPVDDSQALVPFRFFYGWWRGFAVLTGVVVGDGMQDVGVW